LDNFGGASTIKVNFMVFGFHKYWCKITKKLRFFHGIGQQSAIEEGGVS